MRNTTIIGVALIVIIVAVVVILSLPVDKDAADVVEEVERESELDTSLPGSGQFFQQIPAGEGPSVSPTPLPSPASAAVTISLSETGFSPAAVTIAAGTTVTFVNDGQAAHWPASAVHPTHDLLPGFDAKRGLATGETYSYTFMAAGRWGCHDHLMPQYTCAVTAQ